MASAIIIGAGHNGLIAAFYLAKAGFETTVLERRGVVGGGAITEDLHPGFRCPTLTHELLIHERIVHDMDLARHGVEFIEIDTDVCVLGRDGHALVLAHDVQQSVDNIRAFSAKDAGVYAEWTSTLARLSSVLARAFTAPPPSIDAPSAVDLWNLLKLGRAFRALDKRDRYRLLRWAPMPIADLAYEWFESERLCASIAGPGVSGTMLGPWSAGSALVLLMREAHIQLAGGARRRVRGGPGALTAALAVAARTAGARIETQTSVERIVVRSGRAAGVVVDGDRDIGADVILSSADPRTTFLHLVDAADLMPEFLVRLRNYRSSGTVGKINLALSALPAFTGTGTDVEALAGRIQIGPEIDYLERAFDHAKYGEMSSEPWLDLVIPSLMDAQLAPAGGHVASIYVHGAPHHLRSEEWDAARPELLRRTMSVLEEYAPGISALVVAAQVLTPRDLEREYGFAGGHMFHGELALDQLFTMRPVIGHARYDSPIDGLFLCGAGTHPGGFATGASGRLAAREVIARAKHGPRTRSVV